MTENISLSLIQSVVDSQKDLIVIFKGEEHILTNSAFNRFFNVSSLQDYNANFGAIVNNFVPHPSYFHKEKIETNETWLNNIMKRDEVERIVSMMTQTYDPCAFSVKVDNCFEEYTIATFTDITRDLIKRIMIENHVNIDKQSGAYDKKYFLQIAKNYEDATVFNEKILGVSFITIDSNENPHFCNDEESLNEFVNSFNCTTRQDDMLVRWDDDKFLLIYLVDSEQNAQMMINKLQNLVDNGSIKNLGCQLTSAIQKENESINSLIQRVDSNT